MAMNLGVTRKWTGLMDGFEEHRFLGTFMVPISRRSEPERPDYYDCCDQGPSSRDHGDGTAVVRS